MARNSHSRSHIASAVARGSATELHGKETGGLQGAAGIEHADRSCSVLWIDVRLVGSVVLLSVRRREEELWARREAGGWTSGWCGRPLCWLPRWRQRRRSRPERV